ncbi:MAG: YfiR family protein [Betaproteobacteria bacterium]|nr:YfiR family protein [Betaproteobacteria bacterium]
MSLNTVVPGIAFAVLVAVLPAPAPASSLPEYPVKAAFILNFARYAEWPPDHRQARDRTLTLCIVGSDPFGASLAPIEGKNVGGRTLQVRRDVGIGKLKDCEIVFVTEAEERRLASILRAASDHAILTVSDIEGFAEAGGMIGLVTSDQRVRFDINLNALRSANLRLNAQVLRLARSLIGTRAAP